MRKGGPVLQDIDHEGEGDELRAVPHEGQAHRGGRRGAHGGGHRVCVGAERRAVRRDPRRRPAKAFVRSLILLFGFGPTCQNMMNENK